MYLVDVAEPPLGAVQIPGNKLLRRPLLGVILRPGNQQDSANQLKARTSQRKHF
jgi:hypothetical protein